MCTTKEKASLKIIFNKSITITCLQFGQAKTDPN